MAILNVTYAGRSADVPYEVPDGLSDDEIRAQAVEALRSGELRALHHPDLPADAFRFFVVDRMTSTGAVPRIYLRPKVPFGEAR